MQVFYVRAESLAEPGIEAMASVVVALAHRATAKWGFHPSG
jgi:hypothetical protein